jgi:hypothetical protein
MCTTEESGRLNPTNDRLAAICDGLVTAEGYEVRQMAAELLARRPRYLRTEMVDLLGDSSWREP